MRKYLCGVPNSDCCGSSSSISSVPYAKAHSTTTEAFKCMQSYLLKQGYTKTECPRSFLPPDGGPIRVLTKKSHFGTPPRGGKRGDNGADAGNRVRPMKRGGTII